jgi:hypothetical protein
MDLKSIGKIDPVAWQVVWDAISKGYDIADFLRVCRGLLEEKFDPVYFNAMIRAAEQGYDLRHFFDSWSPNQRASKIWLVEELSQIVNPITPMRIQLFGGWFGYPLSDLLMERLNVEFIENIDMDPAAIAMFKYFSSNQGLDEKTTPRMIGTVANVQDKNKREYSADIVFGISSPEYGA